MLYIYAYTHNARKFNNGFYTPPHFCWFYTRHLGQETPGCHWQPARIASWSISIDAPRPPILLGGGGGLPSRKPTKNFQTSPFF